jgi:hypothetical protein
MRPGNRRGSQGNLLGRRRLIVSYGRPQSPAGSSRAGINARLASTKEVLTPRKSLDFAMNHLCRQVRRVDQPATTADYFDFDFFL